jgi:hypothetical protein
MMRELLALLSVCVLFAAGCGGERKSAKGASHPSDTQARTRAKVRGKSREPAKKTRDPEPEPHSLPNQCTYVRDICVPPPEFVDRLCRHNFPDVAVYMMGPRQPWTHRYVRVKEAQAVNPISGRVGAVSLTFGEEIIVLRYKTGGTQGGIQVSGTERYEVLRWDGTCATLEEGEFVEKMPKQQLRHVAPAWDRLGDKYRAALMEQSAVAAAAATRETDCKGAGLGRPPKCHKAIENLNRVVAETVHDGFELPLPESIP